MILKKSITQKKYLFLDRDGVINKRLLGGYITKWEDFEFLPGVLEALKVFKNYFNRIIIITNQQGIGKGLMSENDVKLIHQNLSQTVISHGGKIDAIYHCPMLKTDANNCRKPDIKMALKAQADFLEIDFSQSIMIGDTASDMAFGKNAGMCRILIENEHTTENDREWSEVTLKKLTDLSNLLK